MARHPPWVTPPHSDTPSPSHSPSQPAHSHSDIDASSVASDTSSATESETSQRDLSSFFRSAIMSTRGIPRPRHGGTDTTSSACANALLPGVSKESFVTTSAGNSADMETVMGAAAEEGWKQGAVKEEGTRNRPAYWGHAMWKAVTEAEHGGNAEWFDEEEIHLQINHRWVLNPLGRFRSYWNVYLLLLILYVSTVSVYVYAFFNDLSASKRAFFFFMERLIDVSFVVEIVLSFFTAYERTNPYGWETSPAKIRWRYLLTWFVPDVLATIPWDMVQTDNAPSLLQLPRFLRVIRAVKLVKFLRGLRVKQWFTRMEVRLGIRYGIFRMVKLAVLVSFVAHWTGCIFYFIGAVGLKNGEATWLDNDSLPTNKWGLYIAAVYFSTKTISTVGYGDITPTSTMERIYVTMLMFVGAGVFGFSIGELGNIILTLQESTSRHRNQMDQALDLGRSRGLPEELAFRIRRHLQHRRNGHAVDDQSDLMALMSVELQKQILEHTYRPYLEKSEILQGVPWDALYGRMSNQLARPGEVVFKPGDDVMGMFSVVSGQVVVHTENKAGWVVREYSAGDIFGEKDILLGRKRSGTAVCSGYSELVLTPKDAVLSTLGHGDGSALLKAEEDEIQLLWENILTRAGAEVRACDIAREIRNAARKRRRRLASGSAGSQANTGSEGDWTDSGPVLVSEETVRRDGEETCYADLTVSDAVGRIGSNGVMVRTIDGGLKTRSDVDVVAMSRTDLERAFLEQKEKLDRIRYVTAALQSL